MSAQRDRNQQIRFYYGNAARDLPTILPQDERESASSRVSNDTIGSPLDTELAAHLDSINSLLDRANSHIGKLQSNRRQLSFLIQDLKRMIG